MLPSPRQNLNFSSRFCARAHTHANKSRPEKIKESSEIHGKFTSHPDAIELKLEFTYTQIYPDPEQHGKSSRKNISILFEELRHPHCS